MRKYYFAAMILCLAWLLLLVAAAEEVRVAFIDSGVSVKHLDASRVAAGENLIFPARDTDDRVGHGTATAGIVLGSAELGIPALAAEAVVVPLVCYDTYPSGVAARGDAALMADAIRRAVDDYGCRIVNISMGIAADDPDLADAVAYAEEKGVLLVSAVGNDYENAPDTAYYPAAYDSVVGVGAYDGTGVAAFSGRVGVSVVAPGVNVAAVSNRNEAKAVRRSGTSYACAYVTGVLADMLAADPTLTAADARAALYAAARDVGEAGFDAASGHGLISVADGFVDVHPGDWFYDSVQTLAGRGILSGVSRTVFDPDGEMTRADFLTLLWRACGAPGESAAAWAAEAGIADADAADARTAPLAREDAAILLWRYAAYLGMERWRRAPADTFADSGEFSIDAVAPIAWAAEYGIFRGTGARTFAPHAALTRAAAAVLLTRLAAAAG